MNKIVKSVSSWARKQAKTVSGAGAGVILGLAGTAVVVAAIPDAGGVYHACYRTNTGALRLIDNAVETCTGNESPAQWSQTGPQGPAGADGAPGATGPQGPQGPPGSGSVLINNLVGADLRGAVMVGWQGLTGLNFSGSNLSESRIGSDVSNSNFSNVNFSNSKLYGSTVAGANFSGVNFAAANLSGVNFSGHVMPNLNFFGVTATNASFQNADLNSSTFNSVTGGDFSGANLTNTNFSGGAIRDANYSGVNLTGSTFLTLPGSGGQFDFRNINLTNANFTNVQFTNNVNLSIEFFNTILTGSDMSTLDVSRVVWHSDTTCPDGTVSGSHGNTCVGHLVP